MRKILSTKGILVGALIIILGFLTLQSLKRAEAGINLQVEKPETSFVLRTDYAISEFLISGVNSDLPGQIMAQITLDAYDAATGRYLLIPHYNLWKAFSSTFIMSGVVAGVNLSQNLGVGASY